MSVEGVAARAVLLVAALRSMNTSLHHHHARRPAVSLLLLVALPVATAVVPVLYSVAMAVLMVVGGPSPPLCPSPHRDRRMVVQSVVGLAVMSLGPGMHLFIHTKCVCCLYMC